MTLADRLTGRRVYLDANIFIYALESLAPWDESSRMALDLSESGQCDAVTTELALAECLVKPLRLGNDMAVQTYLQAFQTRPGLHVLPVSRAPVRLESFSFSFSYS